MTRPGRLRDDRGSGSILTIGVACALLVLAWAGCVVVSWLAQSVAAQDAADLAALSGATAMAEGVDACAAASSAAQRNDAHVETCEVRGDRRAFVVEVGVSAPLSPHIAGFPEEVVRTAAAGTG